MRAEAPTPPTALAAIRAPFLEAGAAVVDPPVIQPLNLLLDLAGEAMRARLFIVQDEGGREACLRPDFTVPAARMHLESGAATGRYCYEGKAFRVAPAGAEWAHPEEFVQIGLEAYGEAASPAADAAVAGLAWRAAAAGGRDDLSIRYGDIGLFDAFLAAIEVPAQTAAKLRRSVARPRALAAELDRAQVAPESPANALVADLLALPAARAAAALEDAWRRDGLEETGGRTASEIVERLARRAEAARAPRLSAAQADAIERFLLIDGDPDAALSAVDGLASGAALVQALDGWRARIEALAAEGVPRERMTFAPGFGRAFGYYDGFLFEISAVSLPADAPIGAGGRYDGLFAQLGAPPSTAVGCIVRPARAWKGD